MRFNTGIRRHFFEVVSLSRSAFKWDLKAGEEPNKFEGGAVFGFQLMTGWVGFLSEALGIVNGLLSFLKLLVLSSLETWLTFWKIFWDEKTFKFLLSFWSKVGKVNPLFAELAKENLVIGSNLIYFGEFSDLSQKPNLISGSFTSLEVLGTLTANGLFNGSVEFWILGGDGALSLLWASWAITEKTWDGSFFSCWIAGIGFCSMALISLRHLWLLSS